MADLKETDLKDLFSKSVHEAVAESYLLADENMKLNLLKIEDLMQTDSMKELSADYQVYLLKKVIHNIRTKQREERINQELEPSVGNIVCGFKVQGYKVQILWLFSNRDIFAFDIYEEGKQLHRSAFIYDSVEKARLDAEDWVIKKIKAA